MRMLADSSPPNPNGGLNNGTMYSNIKGTSHKRYFGGIFGGIVNIVGSVANTAVNGNAQGATAVV